MIDTNELMKRFNRKTIIGYTAMATCLGMIVVSSFFPYTIDPSKWGSNEFISDELIIIAITISSLVGMMFIAISDNASNPKSLIAQAKVKFFANVDKVITNVLGFSQWTKQVLQPADQEARYERILKSVGIDNMLYLKLDMEQITLCYTKGAQAIKIDGKGENVYFHSLTKEQFKALRRIKEGKETIEFVDPSYYLSVKSLNATLTSSEVSSHEQERKSSMLARSVTSKLMMSLSFGLIFGGLAYDMSQGSNTATVLLKLFSRLFAMATSSAYGYFTGCQENDLDAFYIEKRVEVQLRFLADKSFRPKSEQELAKEEYIEQRKNDTLRIEERHDVMSDSATPL